MITKIYEYHSHTTNTTSTIEILLTSSTVQKFLYHFFLFYVNPDTSNGCRGDSVVIH